MLVCGIWCAHFARSRTVDGICWGYVGKRMSEQWRSAADTASEGILVVSSTEPHSLLYFNPALRGLLRRMYPGEEVLEKNLKMLEVKLVGAEGLGAAAKKTLSDVLEAAGTSVNGTYYLQKSNNSVEIAITRIFYEGDEALQLSFKQPSLHQTIENARSENKNEAAMISSVTHKLRVPLDGIMEILELLPDHFSKDEPLHQIEMAKECCNMIAVHVNDLSVNFSINFRIMGSCGIRA